MKNLSKAHRFLAGLLSVFISVFLVAGAVWAVTTIGTNISTGGNLTVDGNATTTGNFIIGTSTWTDRPTSTLAVIGSFHVTGITTSSDALWIGSGGTVNSLDMTGGDLYIQDDVEIDGLATSTEGFYSQGTLHVGGDATIDGMTTTTDYIYLPLIKFNPTATPTPEVRGQCFMDEGPLTYGVHCYNGSAWKALYTE